MRKIYVSEPEALNMNLVQELLNDNYELVFGTTDFSGEDNKHCSILLMRSATEVTSSIKEYFPELKHVIRVGVGLDNIDLDFCAHESIAVYNAPAANADAVSDYVVGMMLYGLRNMHLLNEENVVKWNRFKFMGHSLSSRTIGIIGFGNIGKQIFTKLQGFNCAGYVAYDPFVKREDMPSGVTYAGSVEEVLEKSNVVTLHVPLLPTTKHLISRQNLGLLKNGSILINASRGGIVHEADICKYIKSSNLIYIADVTEDEPRISPDLLTTNGAIITPHIASLTLESDDNMIKVALRNFLDGRPIATRTTSPS